MNTPKRPIIPFLFSILLLFKVLSGVGSLAYAQQPITMIICIESFILAYVAVMMHIRSGGGKTSFSTAYSGHCTRCANNCNN